MLRHFSYQGNNEANVILTLDGKINAIFGLVFNLEDDVVKQFPNLKEKSIKLAPHHIVAADTYFMNVFVMFSHPELT
jgi:hypothetical protein